MKTLIVLVLLIAVGAGVYFYTQGAEQMPAAQNNQPQDNQQPTMQQSNPTVVVEISGKNYSFDKKEIRVKQGDSVQVNFTSESGFHDWVVDEFSARTAQVKDGGKTSVTFTADKKGTFEYYCSVGQHRKMGMVGKLIVE